MNTKETFPFLVGSTVVVAVLITLLTGSWGIWVPTILAMVVVGGLWKPLNQQ
jgi:hypothetical protein